MNIEEYCSWLNSTAFTRNNGWRWFVAEQEIAGQMKKVLERNDHCDLSRPQERAA